MKKRLSWPLLIVFLGLTSLHPFLVSCFFNPVEPKPEPTATPRPTYTPTPDPTNEPAATPIPTITPVPTQVIVDYQDFETGNGTLNDHYFEGWVTCTPFISYTTYGGTQAMEAMFYGEAPSGGSVAVFPMTFPYDFSGASVVMAWVNDPGGGQQIQLMIQDTAGLSAIAWSDQTTQSDQWTQLTWQLSAFSPVDLAQTNNVVFSVTEPNTVLFDEVSKQ